MKFLHRTPFVRITMGLIVGILLFDTLTLSPIICIILMLIFFVGIIIVTQVHSTKFQLKYGWLAGVCVLLLFSLLGYWRSYQIDNKYTFSRINHKGLFLSEVVSPAVEKSNSHKLIVKLLCEVKEEKTTLPVSGKAVVYFSKNRTKSPLLVGDKVLLRTTFRRPDGALNPNGFDYANYLRHQGIGAVAYVKETEWRRSNQPTIWSVRRVANNVRNSLLNIYREHNIMGNEFGILGALTLGYTDEIDSSLRLSYSGSGATHILSVSGLHVGIIYLALITIFGFLSHTPGNRIIQSIIIVILLWIYAFITGMSPSVTRATLMFSFVAVGRSLRRQTSIYNTIFLSAFVMLCIWPKTLYHIGFQLSYVAVLSIIYFQPRLARLLSFRHKVARWMWGIVTVSVAAQIGTAPLAIYYFQQFPNYFLLTNFVAIPTATLIIYTALTLLLFSSLPLLSNIIAIILKLLLHLLNGAIDVIFSLPHSITTISMNEIEVILYIGILLTLIIFFHYRNYLSLVAILAFILLFNSSLLYEKYNNLVKTEWIVYADRRVSTLNFVSRNLNNVFTFQQEVAIASASDFWIGQQCRQPQFRPLSNRYFYLFFDQRIMFLTDDFLRNKATDIPLCIDYLVIGNRHYTTESELNCITAKHIIADKTLSTKSIANIRHYCETNNIPFHSIKERGAFVCAIPKRNTFVTSLYSAICTIKKSSE